MATKRSNDLVLFFTQGVSLSTWRDGGMLAREIAVYEKLIERGIGVRFVTYGCADDLAFRGQLGDIQISCNQWNLPVGLYAAQLKMLPPKGSVFKSNQVAGADIALGAARRTGAKFIARCGYLLSDFQERKIGKDSSQAIEARRLEQLVFSGADQIVVTTRAMADALQTNYGIKTEKINVIPNYVETERFIPLAKPKNKKFRVGFVGRLDQQKNVGELVDAAKGLDVELALVGDGPLRMELEERATGQADVHFLGRLDNSELPHFLNSCDAFVLPSLYEGHPKALLEAMSCGLPVVGTRVPGIAETIRDGENGLLCDLNAENIRAAIQRLMADEDLRSRLGQGARKYIEAGFSLERIVDLEMHLLEKVNS